MTVRRPAVAGSFYPADRDELGDLIQSCYLHPVGPGSLPPAKREGHEVVAGVAPHAGYIYSGPIAAHTFLHFSRLPDPELLVVVAPNHYGIGSGVSTFKDGEWETPLGRLKVDSEAAASLASESGIVAFDPEASRMEHSLEVELPFLQQLYGGGVPILPVSLLFQDIETAVNVGEAVAKVVKGRKAVVLASSDLTHYEPYETAKKKDLVALAEVAKMDVPGFYSAVERLNVTACGYGPIAAVMTAARSLGLTKGEVLKYASSGDTEGDKIQVVGYGSLRFV